MKNESLQNTILIKSKTEFNRAINTITNKQSQRMAKMTVGLLVYIYQPVIITMTIGTYNQTLFIAGYLLPILGVIAHITAKIARQTHENTSGV
jgi:hypothetical protein